MKLLNVRPRLIRDDHVNGVLINAILTGKTALGPSRLVLLANLPHLIFRQLGARRTFTAPLAAQWWSLKLWRVGSVILPTLRVSVCNIFGVRHQHEMAGGIPFSANQTLGADAVTSGWTPITADLSVWLVVQLSAY